MNRYSVNWGPYLGQAADQSGGDVVCEGGVCKIVPAGPQTPPAPAPLPSPASAAAAPAPAAPAPAANVAGIPLPWLAVGAAAGVGLLIFALR